VRKIKTEEAIGKILGADVTEVIPGVKKGLLFKRGHIIAPDDIDKLLSIGKHYVWIFGEDEGFVHEDDASRKMLEALKGKHLLMSEPSESKIKLIAEENGTLIVNKKGLREINNLKYSRVASRMHLSFVRKNTPVAIGKVMPIEISVHEMNKIIETAEMYKPIIEVWPIKPHKIAIFPVGNEFIEGRRKESMSSSIEELLDQMGQETLLKKILPDNERVISHEGLKALESGADILIYMGGMSVDPDDRTVIGITNMAVDIMIYGVPIWPGTTFLIAYKNNKLILGIPSSAGFIKNGTSFHRLLPIFLSDYPLSKDEILDMGNGGFIDPKIHG
jgi:hypothetical protein